MKKIILIAAIVTFVISLSFSGSFSAEMVLKAGIAKTDITPDESIHLGGYTLRENVALEGIYGPLYTRVLVFDDGTNKIVFIENDVMDMKTELYDKIRKRVSDETGIPVKYLLVGSVHNHAAPAPGYYESNNEWIEEMIDKVVITVKKAVENLQPVKIGGGTGHSRVAINRRERLTARESVLTFDENWVSQSYGQEKTDNPVMIREIEGVVRLGYNPEGTIDDEVGIIRIDDLSGNPVAVFINYACHGTSLGGRNRHISPEWMGHMLEYFEVKHPGVIGLFAIGAAGDINPRFTGGLNGCKDNLENTKELGYEIGNEVVTVFNSIQTTEPVDPKIRLITKDILLPRRYGKLSDDFRKTTIVVPTTALRIDNFTWVTFPGELFHEIGIRIKNSMLSKSAFMITHHNGALGYLPTQEAFSEGGYEPSRSHFAPVSEQVYVKEVKDLLMNLLW
ncbi:neutral/alkaline non-lysosomal ceramidase N-terminal domain-containing protein [bacterium]|nr:neutral/alkaline non-lysosomal ceramidase N-terminal domain-containing protein [bacterium]